MPATQMRPAVYTALIAFSSTHQLSNPSTMQQSRMGRLGDGTPLRLYNHGIHTMLVHHHHSVLLSMCKSRGKKELKNNCLPIINMRDQIMISGSGQIK